MEELSKSDYLHRRLVLISKIIGFNVISDGWHFIYRTCFVLLFIVYTLITYFYNLWKYSTDFNFVCFSTILSPPAAGAIYRLVFWSWEHKLVLETYETRLSLHKNVHEKLKAARIIEKHNYFANFLCALILYLVQAVGLAVAVSPFLISLFTNAKVQLALPLYVIGLDPHTTIGFNVNFMFQLVAICCGVFVFGLIQCLVVILLDTVATQIEILRVQVREFEASILMKEKYWVMKKKFIQIVDEHNKVLEYARHVEKLLSFQLFLDVSLFSIAAVIAIFYARMVNWLPGYVMGLSIVFLGFLNHSLGELTTVQNERLLFEIYKNSWYTMDVRLQLMYMILLKKAQKTHLFTCGGFRPIGLELFASFCNSIYSYFILLNNLLTKYA